jgi:YVTN family beta-propeller protein
MPKEALAFACVLYSGTALAQNAYIPNFNPNTVSVIDTVKNTVIATVPVVKPSGAAVSPDGLTAYITGGISPGWGRMIAIDTVHNRIMSTIPL